VHPAIKNGKPQRTSRELRVFLTSGNARLSGHPNPQRNQEVGMLSHWRLTHAGSYFGFRGYGQTKIEASDHSSGRPLIRKICPTFAQKWTLLGKSRHLRASADFLVELNDRKFNWPFSPQKRR
jgi:hypothetical protein